MPAFAQAPNAAPQGHVNDLVFHVADLVYRVDDMGGKIESLQVKETSTEVRIDLSADVLFAFDKADLLPKAQQTLSQAAAIIRDKAKGTVRIDTGASHVNDSLPCPGLRVGIRRGRFPMDATVVS